MLRAAMPVARDLGIARALLTTDPDNLASEKVILACGGVRTGTRDDTVYFELPTG